jgi:hypothetical protein
MPRSFADLKAIRLERRLAATGADRQQPRDFHARHGFDPNQPRVPAGNSDGGQWTSENAGGQNEMQIVSDATPDNRWKPGAQYAQARGRNSGPIRTEPGQAARLAAAQARAHDAIARVRECDPNWRPRPSVYESAEGRSVPMKPRLGKRKCVLPSLAASASDLALSQASRYRREGQVVTSRTKSEPKLIELVTARAATRAVQGFLEQFGVTSYLIISYQRR